MCVAIRRHGAYGIGRKDAIVAGGDQGGGRGKCRMG